MISSELAAHEAGKPKAWFVWTEVGLTLWLYYILITFFIAAPPFIVPALGFQLDLRQGTAVTFGGVLVAEAIAFAVLVWWMRRRSLSWRSMGFVKPARWLPVAAAILFAALYSAYTLTIPEVRQHATELSAFKCWGASVAVLGAAVEEIVFRGFVLAELQRRRIAAWVQVVVSGVAFGLLHLGFSWWGMLLTTAMGMVLAVTCLWSGRSLVAPIVGHCLINAIIEPWLLLWIITFYAKMINSA